MNESIETLKKLLANVEKGTAAPEVKEKVKAALNDAIEALEEKERGIEKSEDDNEFGLTADPTSDYLFQLSQGGQHEAEQRRRSAVSTLVGLTKNVPAREPKHSAAEQLAKLVKG